ncbi:hypothetical protein [Flavobacterium olei]|uniref:hypothetical protein n=1 Tax=Flavobacterium olei TaxID=1886782 RepID=UPI00321A8A73
MQKIILLLLIIFSQILFGQNKITETEKLATSCNSDRIEKLKIGIIPDIEVKPTIKGIQEGRDEILERALKFIEMGV